ncbi:MAG: hypothetical protein L7S64_03620, partial [Longimicrobiales bacterium]|nr:hypothetical protein [Longimicrobiales bacterium]
MIATKGLRSGLETFKTLATRPRKYSIPYPARKIGVPADAIPGSTLKVQIPMSARDVLPSNT